MKGVPFTPLAAIFDIDDTLLDNYPQARAYGLHEYARLLAIREIGEKHGIDVLAHATEEHNAAVYYRAREHSVEGGVWQFFYETGLVKTPKINHTDPLLQEIAARKHELYEPILQEFGAPLPKAVEFVKAMYVLTNGKLAIASGALRKNVDSFLKTSGMDGLFLPERIITRDIFSHAKPHPESFDKAFQTLGLQAKDRARVLAFEDDPKGIASAKQAGLYVCAITSRFDAAELADKAQPPDMVRDGYVNFAAALGIDL